MAKETKIKQKLQMANVTQAEIARKLHLTVQHVNYVVNGSRRSDRLVRQIYAICDSSKNKILDLVK